MIPDEGAARGGAFPPFDPKGARLPMLSAHRGGNDRRALRAALTAGVDWLETDVWWHYGRIVARHDRGLWRLPLTYSRRRIALGPLRPVMLDHLLDAVDGTPTRLLIDLKGIAPRLPGAIAAALRRRDAVGRAALCGQEWEPLDAARAALPSLPVFFSLGRPEHVPAYLRRLGEGSAPPLASISHRLLTHDLVTALRERGVTVIAWTVNEPARARELVSWGVQGITSDSLALLRGLRDHSAV